jgi:cell division GTPase FtsZ
MLDRNTKWYLSLPEWGGTGTGAAPVITISQRKRYSYSWDVTLPFSYLKESASRTSVNCIENYANKSTL